LIDRPGLDDGDRLNGRTLSQRILLVLGALILSCIGIALGLLMGRRIVDDQWPMLITATGIATYVAITLIDARHALLIWIVTAPFARFVYLNVELGRGIPNLTLNRIMTGVLIVYLLAELAVGRRSLTRVNLADIALIGFVGTAALSLPSAVLGLKSAAQSFFDLIVVPAAIYYLARNLITSRDGLRSVIYALTAIGLYLALMAIHEQLTGNVWFYPEDRSVQYTASIRRVVGLLGNPAYIAVTISMAVPWVWLLVLDAKRNRILLLVLAGLLMAGVYFCMNRSAWVGLIVSLLTMAIFVKRFRKVFVAMVVVGVIVLGAYWAQITASATVQERLMASGPIDYRLETWDIALRMIRDHPWFGVGYENFRHLYERYGYWDVYLRATPTPHNTYLWVILMGGVVTFVPFMLFIAAVLLSSLRVRASARRIERFAPDRDLAGTFVASMASILAPALVMDVLTGYYNTMVMFLIIGAFSGAMSGIRRADAVRSRTRLAALFVEPL